MAKNNCAICQSYTEMTFEHIPPRSAFNNIGIHTQNLEEALKQNGRYSWQKRGAGEYSLCKNCNASTGGWYGEAYKDWDFQGYSFLLNERARNGMFLSFNIYPLRVIKQIISMFASSCGAGWMSSRPEISKWLLNPDHSGFPDKNLRLYMGIMENGSTLARQTGMMASLVLGKGVSVVSEISFPPFVYILGQNVEYIDPNARLHDITSFAEETFKTKRDYYIPLDKLPVHTNLADFGSGTPET